jgi:hypothetical protein
LISGGKSTEPSPVVRIEKSARCEIRGDIQRALFFCRRIGENPVVIYGMPDSFPVMKQTSREALIELLFLSLYLDDHLSLAEDEVLTTALESLGWDSKRPREHHILTAFSLAREVATCAIKTEKFVVEKADIIKADGEEAPAMTWLSRVLGADGLTYSEQRFLGQLEARLFPKA